MNLRCQNYYFTAYYYFTVLSLNERDAFPVICDYLPEEIRLLLFPHIQEMSYEFFLL